MTEVDRSRSARLSVGASTVVLAGAVLTSASFLLAVWGVHAPGVGQRNFNVAFGLAILAPLAIYASLFISALASVGAILAWRLRWPLPRWLVALGLSLVPLLSVLARDAGLI
jgi:hypothetical protein